MLSICHPAQIELVPELDVSALLAAVSLPMNIASQSPFLDSKTLLRASSDQPNDSWIKTALTKGVDASSFCPCAPLASRASECNTQCMPSRVSIGECRHCGDIHQVVTLSPLCSRQGLNQGIQPF